MQMKMLLNCKDSIKYCPTKKYFEKDEKYYFKPGKNNKDESTKPTAA